MGLEHLDEVMEIERLSFPTPWSRGAYQREILDNSYARYIVALLGGRVVGYAGMWVLMDEAHVTNIAVHPDYRHLGIGERILRELIRRAYAAGADKMTLEVRVSNVVAQNLYKKLGFAFRGIRRGYYTDTHEDAMIMWRNGLGDDKNLAEDGRK